MAANTPEFSGWNSLPDMFQGLPGSISFPKAVPWVMISSMISSLYIFIGELYCLEAIFGLPTVVKPWSFCPGNLPVFSKTLKYWTVYHILTFDIFAEGLRSGIVCFG